MWPFKRKQKSKNQASDDMEFIARYDNDSSTDEIIRAPEIKDAYSIAILHANGRGHKEIYVWPNRPGSGIEIDEGYLWKNANGTWIGEWGPELIETRPIIDDSVPTSINCKELYCPQCLSKNILADSQDDRYGDPGIRVECQNCGCVADLELYKGKVDLPIEFNCDIINNGAGYSIDSLIHYQLAIAQSDYERAILSRADVRRWIWKYLGRIKSLDNGNGPSLDELAEEEPTVIYCIFEFLNLYHNRGDKDDVVISNDDIYISIMDHYENDNDPAWLQLLDEAYEISVAIQKDMNSSKAKKKEKKHRLFRRNH